MPNRLRLYDFRISRGPKVLGICQGDVKECAEAVNTAQRRLIMAREAGDEGWWGSWAEMAFNVTQANPFITTPRGVARLEKMDVCNRPVFIQNQFYEYLDFGNGHMPRLKHHPCLCHVNCYSRNNAVTFVDLVNPPKIIRVYTTDDADDHVFRVLVQGTDINDTVVRTQDGLNQVQGEFLILDSPFTDSKMMYNSITGIQKDKTTGSVQIFQVDPNTGDEELMLIMEPGETVASYRRYFLDRIPINCCNNVVLPQQVQVTAMAKLELIPAVVDTDYLLIQNLEALIEEAQSARYSEIDSTSSKSMAQEKHLQAIRLLQGELVHYLGKDRPAINFAPFGSARLEHQKIGTMI